MRGKCLQRRGIGHFPAVEDWTLALGRINHHALLAIVHAEGQRRAALIDQLHAEEAAAIGGPVLQALGPNAHISKCLQVHRPPLSRCCVYLPWGWDFRNATAQRGLGRSFSSMDVPHSSCVNARALPSERRTTG